MRPVKCNNCKKFFDADKYEICPHCNQSADSFAASPMEKVQTPPQPIKREEDFVEHNAVNNVRPVVVQCTLCKKFYDASRDEVCPHCNGVPETPPQEEIKVTKENIYSHSEDEPVVENKVEEVVEPKEEKVVETKAEKVPEEEATPEFVTPVSISEAVKKADSVQSNDALERYADSKTVAFYNLSNDVEPVVGWLVGLKGEYKGVSFSLKSGRNYIGRSLNMDVALAKENTVSRDRHAIISFDPKQRKFFIEGGESRGLTYVNGGLLMSFKELNMYDVVSLGACDLMFVPLCSERFSWENVH